MHRGHDQKEQQAATRIWRFHVLDVLSFMEFLHLGRPVKWQTHPICVLRHQGRAIRSLSDGMQLRVLAKALQPLAGHRLEV
eukprot:1320100-Amphidinium_carterae.1